MSVVVDNGVPSDFRSGNNACNVILNTTKFVLSIINDITTKNTGKNNAYNDIHLGDLIGRTFARSAEGRWFNLITAV